jgi:hypothetical protein
MKSMLARFIATATLFGFVAIVARRPNIMRIGHTAARMAPRNGRRLILLIPSVRATISHR